MNNPSSPYVIDTEARTVTHKQTGIVVRFEPHPDGGWAGAAANDTIPPGLTLKYLSGLASRMGDAWAMSQNGGMKR